MAGTGAATGATKVITAPTSVTSAALGEITLIGQPIELSRTPSRIATAPPERGEHTDEILAEMGYTAQQRDDLRQRQVI